MSSKKYILLIEDNKQDELLTLRAFKQNGVQHEVIICRDGAEALDWIHMQGKHAGRDPLIIPTVILLDLKLPKVDGIEVLKDIRKHVETKLWPIVILTTSKEESDIAASYGGGANSYVQKPIDFAEFSEAIRNLGVYWMVLNQPPVKPKAQVRP